MKLIGLIGGMSWESTAHYYEIINNIIKEELGGFNSAKCLLYSVNFQEIEACQRNNEWDKSAKILSEVAINLENASAEFIIICTNTMHKVVDEIQSNIKIPIIHIAEPTIEVLKTNNIQKVGLLGTKYTMQQDFYKAKLMDDNIEVIIPNEKDIDKVNDIIFNELCLGIISEASKELYLKIIEDLVAKGAQGIILGCTEIGMLVNQDDTDIPLFDTTYIHAKAAALLSIEK